MSRLRPALSMLLVIIGGVLLPLGVMTEWARGTMFESDVLSQRAVTLLDSETVRRQLAEELTTQLARSGNQQAVLYRPALQLAVEAVIDTDSFRSIFRTAVRRAHQAILDGDSGAGLDLSDSLAIITSTAQLAPAAHSGSLAPESGGLAGSLDSTVSRLAGLHVWGLRDVMSEVAGFCLLGSGAAALAALLASTDRRRTARHLGRAIILGGAAIVLVLFLAQRLLERSVADPDLADAVGGAFSRATSDLHSTGLWLACYGIVVVAAAAAGRDRYTPARVRQLGADAVARLRRSRLGTATLGAAAIFGGITVLGDPSGVARLVVVTGSMYLVYLGVTELLGLITATVRAAGGPAGNAATRRRTGVREVALGGFAVLTLIAVVSLGLVATGRRAARAAESAGQQRCNGDHTICDLRLDEVTFAGSHNAMSSTLYAGWLFAEQVETIRGQLDAGIRAFLIDTHYGIPSTARVPGSESPLVLTDLASELQDASREKVAPEVAARAAQVAARAPQAAGAQRSIYLCHNYCELGAVPFASVLADLKAFLDANPDEIVLLVIQDATTPADTTAAIQRAGLAERAAALPEDEPMPTLRELIDARTNLVVFAETGSPDSPAWYHSAYDGWFQETPYEFASTAEFTCGPNRGTPDAPLFLVNHWVSASPPDPAKAAAANDPAVLESRMEACLAERGQLPNIVAIDFAARSRLDRVIDELNEARLAERRQGTPSTTGPATGLTTSTTTAARPPTTLPASSALPPPTEITSLTGGSPVALCSALPAALTLFAAWAYASLTAPPEELGLADLVAGPALARELRSVVDAAPTEVAARVQPVLDRADRAVAELMALGLDQAAIDGLDQGVTDALADPEGPDGLVVVLTAGATLGDQVGRTALTQASNAFYAAEADPATLADLGTVSDEVARDAGFACLADPAAG